MTDGERHFVVAADELDEGERVVADVEHREIAVFNLDGEYYALANYCVHQGGPACEGRLAGKVVETDGELAYDRDGEFVCCPWHGWEFDITDGRNLAHPEEFALPTYDVSVEDGDLYVAL